MHNREYTVFLRPHSGGLMLHTMYYAEEVRQVEGFGAPDVELKAAEVKVAHQLIEALAAEWDPEKYHDTFQENVKKLIETKLEGGKITEVEKPKKLAPVVDLMAALKQSLAEMEGKKKPAAPAREAEGQAVQGEGVENSNWRLAIYSVGVSLKLAITLKSPSLEDLLPSKKSPVDLFKSSLSPAQRASDWKCQ